MAFDWDDYYSNCTVQYVGQSAYAVGEFSLK